MKMLHGIVFGFLFSSAVYGMDFFENEQSDFPKSEQDRRMARQKEIKFLESLGSGEVDLGLLDSMTEFRQQMQEQKENEISLSDAQKALLVVKQEPFKTSLQKTKEQKREQLEKKQQGYREFKQSIKK